MTWLTVYAACAAVSFILFYCAYAFEDGRTPQQGVSPERKADVFLMALLWPFSWLVIIAAMAHFVLYAVLPERLKKSLVTKKGARE